MHLSRLGVNTLALLCELATIDLVLFRIDYYYAVAFCMAAKSIAKYYCECVTKGCLLVQFENRFECRVFVSILHIWIRSGSAGDFAECLSLCVMFVDNLSRMVLRFAFASSVKSISVTV